MGGTVQTFRVVDDVVRHANSARHSVDASLNRPDPLLFGDWRGGRARARAFAGASTQAAEAERLLAPIAANEPGLARLLDAIRGVRALEASHHPSRSASMQVTHELVRELRAVEPWKAVHGMDATARAAVVDELRGRTADQLTSPDWQVLAGILGDDVDNAMAPGLPRTLGPGALSMRELALSRIDMPHESFARKSRLFVGHQYWDAWKASEIPVEARRARISELLSGEPMARTQEEWRELGGLLNAGDHGVQEHHWFPGLRPEAAVRAAFVSGYERVRELRIDVSMASDAQLDAARAALRGPGDLDELATAIVQQGKLGEVGIVGTEAAAVRLRHLDPRDPNAARAWLGDVRDALRRTSPDGPVAELRQTAFGLIDKNVARIDGDRWWRPLDGYSNHPDYAELGRVRTIYQLLEQVGAVDAPRTPASAASAADDISW